MSTEEINPNHGVTKELREHWQNLMAIVLWKSGALSPDKAIKITSEDIAALQAAYQNPAVVTHSRKDSLDLYLASNTQARELAQEEMG